jgi:DNA-binding winged helix-turn-helix (wHTH) protein
MDRRELRTGDSAVAVEPQVFDLLAYLISNRERVVSQDDLLSGVWNGRIVSESTMRSRINAARAAIGDNGEEQRLIRTLPRRGFRFVGSVEERPAETGAAALPPSAAVAPEPPAPLASAIEPGVSEGSAPVDRSHWTRPWLPLVGAAGLVVVAAALVMFAARPGPAPLPATPAPPAAIGVAFDPAVVPLISDAARRSLRTYVDRPNPKALAISRGHMVVVDGAADAERARADALQRCGEGARSGAVCRLYAVGNEVVWSQASLPLPAPGEVRDAPLDAPLVAAEVPTITSATRNRVDERYVEGPSPKALALATGGIWYVRERTSRAEAARLAVEECADYWQRPCILVSVDGQLTLQIPKSRPVTRIFLPSREDGMSDADRQRVAEVYRAAEWRALARGKDGWHPAADAPSEAAAVDAALAACAKTDTECRLHAIGNFIVAEPPR